MPKYVIEINGNKWTKTAAQLVISKYMWNTTRFPTRKVQLLPHEAQNFVRQYMLGGPQDTILSGASHIGVEWLHVGRTVPTLVFCFGDGTSRRVSYRSLRDRPERAAEKKELRILRLLTNPDRKNRRRVTSHHVDDVAPGTFQWRARLFKKHWLADHATFDPRYDTELQTRWRDFYNMFPLESVTQKENHRRKIDSDRMERVYKHVEEAAPNWVKSLHLDRAALWVKWRNDGGWDVPDMDYIESEWADLPLLTRARVRDWLGTFI
jgi:hypothetical protein